MTEQIKTISDVSLTLTEPQTTIQGETGVLTLIVDDHRTNTVTPVILDAAGAEALAYGLLAYVRNGHTT